MKCPDCGDKMILRDSNHRLFWGCKGHPLCGATLGAHPDGRPLGLPVTKDVRFMRYRLHELFKLIWDWENRKDKSKMYSWMRKNAPREHIGQMNREELLDLEEILHEHFFENDIKAWIRNVKTENRIQFAVARNKHHQNWGNNPPYNMFGKFI